MTISYLLLKDQKVKVSNKVWLATDVYLPAQYRIGIDLPLPTVLERTPYGKHLPSRSEIHETTAWSRAEVAEYFVHRGYALVYQDCRGCYNSDGVFTKYLSEGQDGYETFGWISKQPWCNGKIGTMGLSYAAHVQMAVACLNPPALSCMILDSGGFSNSYQGGIRQGGAFELKQVTWAYRQAIAQAAASNDRIAFNALKSQNLHTWFEMMPWKEGHSPLAAVPAYESYVFEQWKHERFDDFWKQLGIYAQGYYDTMRKVPTILMSSWYDAYVPTTIDNFNALSKEPHAPVYLIMGPWLHGDRNITYSGDVSFGAAASLDGQLATNWLALRAQWFDMYLKGYASDTDFIRCHLFLMGGGSGLKDGTGKMDHGGMWIESLQFPLSNTDFVPFYLHHDGGLSQICNVDSQNQCITYMFDPKSPVPTIGGSVTSGGPIFHGGAFDQREDSSIFGAKTSGIPLAARHDVVVFETPVLETSLAVVGPIKVKLWVSSDALDTDFTAKLVDVHSPNADYPCGYAMNIADGIFRCRFRDSWSEPTLMKPGNIYEITIDLGATANVFQRGHKLRVDISSSNFPHYDVNPNTGETPALSRSSKCSRNTIHLDSGLHQSHILLPLAPATSIIPLRKRQA
jgi:putative CocE/NonD family hydrolase